MKSGAPPWVGRTGDISDTDVYAGMTPEHRLLCFIEVCRLADAILAGRPDRERVLAEQEPLHPDDERTWRRLVQESRRAAAAR